MAVFRPSLSNYDVEKVSSAHRALNQIEYQVEVPLGRGCVKTQLRSVFGGAKTIADREQIEYGAF
jgi:hypothetical protein